MTDNKLKGAKSLPLRTQNLTGEFSGEDMEQLAPHPYVRVLPGAPARRVSFVRQGAPVLYGDGVHDDAPALQAFIDSDVFQDRTGLVNESCGWIDGVLKLPDGDFYLCSTLSFVGLKKGSKVKLGAGCLSMAHNASFFECSSGQRVELDGKGAVMEAVPPRRSDATLI